MYDAWDAVCEYASIDVVVFANGDQLTGEFKSLERGMLRFKTDATGTISIEWDKVAHLTSNRNIQVETENGDRYLGQLVPSGEESRVVVQTQTDAIDLSAAQVVLMAEIEANRKDRFDGDVTAGYNYSKASEVEQLRFGLDMDFRTETRVVSLTLDSIVSDSAENESSQRQSLDLNYTRLRSNHWLTGGVLRLDRNDELDLDLRVSLGIGAGRILRQTNSTTLQLLGGVQVSRENVSSGLPNEDNVEAFGTLTWDWFRYDTPELDLSTNFQVIPSLTDSGRVRAELDIKLNWELIEDLFWQISFYDSFDSNPVFIGAEKNDYGIATSVGWEF